MILLVVGILCMITGLYTDDYVDDKDNQQLKHEPEPSKTTVALSKGCQCQGGVTIEINDMCSNTNPCEHTVTIDGLTRTMNSDDIYNLLILNDKVVPSHFKQN